MLTLFLFSLLKGSLRITLGRKITETFRNILGERKASATDRKKNESVRLAVQNREEKSDTNRGTAALDFC